MKRYWVVVAASLWSMEGLASVPVYQPIGSSFTLGTTANQRSLTTSLNNPAAPYLMTMTDTVRFGFLGPLGLGYEMGEVSDLSDRVDELEDILSSEDYSSVDAVNSAISEANSIISEIADTAYIKVSGSLQTPFMPVIYKTSFNGTIMLDSGVSFVGKANLLADDITYSISGTDIALETDTSLYVKAATDLRVGLGYSQVVFRQLGGALIAGAKVNMHKISLGRALSVLTDDSDDSGDAFSDSLFDDQSSETRLGLDVGVIWAAPYYQVGATLANINEPDFDYSELGSCSGLSGSSLVSCNSAVNLSEEGELDLTETYTMEKQLTFDAGISTRDRNFMLAGSYDANSVSDPVGDKYQWRSISLSYFSDNPVVPAIRVGYRNNMAGTELSYATFGMTFFKRLNFDLAYGLDKVEDDDGNSLPQSIYLSLGYEFAF